jgi:hypothetical protein
MLEVPQEAIDHAEKIINEGTDEDILALFAFDSSEPREMQVFKFQYWAYKVYPRYFQSAPASFHADFARNMFASYYNEGNYINLGFRGCAKTSYAKLFLAYVLLNDMEHNKKYIKVLARNFGNAKQIVTDIYNMIVEVRKLYGNIVKKDKNTKQEETMATFTTVDGVKLMAGTIGMTQRGHVQDAYRPDFLVFDDVEDRESISSLAQTESTIWRIDEAIQGLSADGSYMCLGNYISDEGVIQWFLNKANMKADLIPIQDDQGNPTWEERYPKEKIDALRKDADDFYGEYMVDPTRAEASFFERQQIESNLLTASRPHRESAGIRYWGDYKPHHRYGVGADTSEGVGKDANAFVLFDFGAEPSDPTTVVATYFNNNIPPDLFGLELVRVGQEFGNCIIAPEANNTGHATISAMRGYPAIYKQRDESKSVIRTTERLGWRTTSKSKPHMFFEFRKDYYDGKIIIKDENLLKEMRSYTTLDLSNTQVGLATRHFDLLTSAVIGYQMKKYAQVTYEKDLKENMRRTMEYENHASQRYGVV